MDHERSDCHLHFVSWEQLADETWSGRPAEGIVMRFEECSFF